MSRWLLTSLVVAITVVTLLFLLLPIVGIFVHTSPGRLLDQLSNPVVRDAFVVTLKTSLVAQTLIVVFGTPTAYLLASRRFPGHAFAITLVELPLVLPPAVAGVGLLAALGRNGLLGSSLQTFGITIPFTQAAVTIAVLVSTMPFVPHAQPTRGKDLVQALLVLRGSFLRSMVRNNAGARIMVITFVIPA